jgi:hypothetical protein
MSTFDGFEQSFFNGFEKRMPEKKFIFFSLVQIALTGGSSGGCLSKEECNTDG